MNDIALDRVIPSPALAPVLAIKGLSIALPPGADRGFAVAGVDLVLRPGEVTCLVGESGSGKSMVAKAVMGLLPPRVQISAGTLAFGRSTSHRSR
jgi:peptide/nickel transport system ATP-binding protein